MYQKRKTMQDLLILAVDLISIFISLSLAFYIRYHHFIRTESGLDQRNILAYIMVLNVFVAFLMDNYHHFFIRKEWGELRAVLEVNIVLCMTSLALFFVLHISDNISRLVIGYTFVINIFLDWIIRSILKRYLLSEHRRQQHSSKVLLVTDFDRAVEVIKNINEYNDWYHRLIGAVLLDNATTEMIGNLPVVANIDNFMEFCVHHDVDEVMFMSSHLRDIPMWKSWIRDLVEMGAKVDVNIDIFDAEVFGKKTVDRVGKYAVASFARNMFSERELFIKRTMDIIGGLIGMVFLCIATIFVAPAIKLTSPGPVFFGQTRVGKNGRKFTFYKFRSMYQDAEDHKKELMEQNEVDGPMFKMTEDPRVTKVGRFLRKTSIDELPQFWNILKGDMSLVGTRPPTVDEFERYEAKHKCRLSMTMGLTGLWQISGRSEIKDFEEVVKLDMQYIDNWSIWLDIKILLKTVVTVCTGRGSR